MESLICQQDILVKLIDLLKCQDAKLVSHILWIFANLTTKTNTKIRDYILNKTDFKSKLLDLMSLKPNSIKKTLLWNISNIISSFSLSEREGILNMLNECLQNSDSTRGVLREALSVIVNISSDTDDADVIDILFQCRIQETVMECLKAILDKMDKRDITLQVYLVKILCNLMFGSPKQIKVIYLNLC